MDSIIRRSYHSEILALLGKGAIVVLTGHRRAGKSCVLEELVGTLSERGNVVYLDMENPDTSDIRSWESLNEYIKEHLVSGVRNYILIDEVQEIAEFERVLRYYVKQEGVDIIVTGSNARMLSSEIATLFSGRYFRVHIQGLDYGEYLQFNDLEDSDAAMQSYLQWGGLPFLHQVSLEDTRTRRDYLSSIYDTIFIKDIVTRRKVRNVTMLDNLARFVADNTGKVFSPNSIAKYLKGGASSVAASTVGEYMGYFCEAYLIDKVRRYDIRGKRIFEQQEKYYFEDIGIRNILCADKRNVDIEKVLENVVYLQLRRNGYDVFVGQLDGKEIDFVARRGDDTAYYQVALSVRSEETYTREFGNLKLISDNHPKYVVTLDPAAPLMNDAGIRSLPLRDFLLNAV